MRSGGKTGARSEATKRSEYCAFWLVASLAASLVANLVVYTILTPLSLVAALSLTFKQKIKGCLVLITALSSMYLFSVLEVKDERDEEHDHLRVLEVGAVGMLTLTVAVAIDIISTVYRFKSQGEGGVHESTTSHAQITSTSRLSTGDINDGMSLGALV